MQCLELLQHQSRKCAQYDNAASCVSKSLIIGSLQQLAKLIRPFSRSTPQQPLGIWQAQQSGIPIRAAVLCTIAWNPCIRTYHLLTSPSLSALSLFAIPRFAWLLRQRPSLALPPRTTFVPVTTFYISIWAAEVVACTVIICLAAWDALSLDVAVPSLALGCGTGISIED